MVYSRSALSNRRWQKCYITWVQCHSREPHVTPEHLKCGWCTWGSGFLFVFNVAAVLVSTVLGPRWVSLEIRCVCVHLPRKSSVWFSNPLSFFFVTCQGDSFFEAITPEVLSPECFAGFYENCMRRDLPSCSGVGTLCFLCREFGFDPWMGSNGIK